MTRLTESHWVLWRLRYAPCFAGTVTTRYCVTTRYWVYDGWNIGVRAAVTITGAPGATVIEGTDGDDVIYSGAGKDRIDGGADVDTIHGGRDFDTIHSVDLADTIRDDADGYELLLTAPTPAARVAPVVRDDAVYVAPDETRDIGVLDNDHDPNENLVATSLSITTAPTLGAAYVVVSAGGDLVVRYIAGDSGGVDSFAYQVCDTLDACSTAQVTITVGAGHCTIVGTDGDDTLRGTRGVDVICGLGGDDVLYGLDGNDVLIGGPGDDWLYGGIGKDTLHGGAGDDTLIAVAGKTILDGGPGDDTLDGGDDSDYTDGGGATDTCTRGEATARCET